MFILRFVRYRYSAIMELKVPLYLKNPKLYEIDTKIVAVS